MQWVCAEDVFMELGQKRRKPLGDNKTGARPYLYKSLPDHPKKFAAECLACREIFAYNDGHFAKGGAHFDNMRR